MRVARESRVRLRGSRVTQKVSTGGAARLPLLYFAGLPTSVWSWAGDGVDGACSCYYCAGHDDGCVKALGSPPCLVCWRPAVRWIGWRSFQGLAQLRTDSLRELSTPILSSLLRSPAEAISPVLISNHKEPGMLWGLCELARRAFSETPAKLRRDKIRRDD